MKEQNDEQLLRELVRRNWVIFLLLLMVSLFWWSPAITLGVAGGGAISIGGFHWLYRSLRKLLFGQDAGTARQYQLGYVARLGALAIILVLLLRTGAHPLGLAAGLSVVILNILWTTCKRAI